jgi:pectin methylesterase-like acyl-CoA thioesterase
MAKGNDVGSHWMDVEAPQCSRCAPMQRWHRQTPWGTAQLPVIFEKDSQNHARACGFSSLAKGSVSIESP